MTDQPPPAPLQEHRFPCEKCGADLHFSPKQGTLVCPHCGHVSQAISPDGGPWDSPMRELDLRQALADPLSGQDIEETRVTTCPSCAAQIHFADGNHATQCPFCATPVVADTGTHRHIKPRGLLPFAVAETTAHQAMSDWLGTLWFAPTGLSDYARKNRRMDGIYVPYWTFDADTRSTYSGERGTVYYKTNTEFRDGKSHTTRERRVRWTRVSGRVARFFDDVLVLASRSLPKDYTDALEPWDLSALVPYRPEYLAGFNAEGYTVDLEDGFHEAHARMDRIIARDVRFDIGGDEQRIHDIRTELGALTFRHVLLPVWLAAYKYRGKTYRFVVNGRTGRVRGERPWSGWKIFFAALAGAIVAVGVGYLLAQSGIRFSVDF